MLARLARVLPAVKPNDGWIFQHVREDDLVFERCWRQHGDYRLHVHRIPPAETLYWHPHAQPTAVLVLGGPYELRVARVGSTEHVDPPAVARMLASGPFWYEMTHAESWHAIRAHGLVHSVMLTHAAAREVWSPSLEPLLPAVPAGLVETIDEIIDHSLVEARGAPAPS